MRRGDCAHLTTRDDGYGQYERHDEYCLCYNEWCPDCLGCRRYERDTDRETDDD